MTSSNAATTMVSPPASDEEAMLLHGYRKMVIGRRFDQQATNLAKQGSLAVYPSSSGQEACQVGAVTALRSTDWLFPTYRDSVAVVSRGVGPGEALTLLRGDWHCGYDPKATRTAPHCTPLATQAAHAVGLTMAARLNGDDVVAVVLCGDGATSEGDFHEAVNLAAVYDAPVVFLVQNNRYAISVPLAKQTRAEALAAKAAGYGITGVQIDGNDFGEVHRAVSSAVDAARAGRGPTLIEALTYRMAPHTNADDPSRYRDPAEALAWREKDPVARLASTLRAQDLLDDVAQRAIDEEAAEFAARTRQEVTRYETPAPAEMFAHVYARPTPQLMEQARELAERGIV
ncbi:thiamine pyrophosphate-dependent enzyme [Streptomyces sp. NPDC001410]|uniref:thiamine pyrophosphate-dependent enzyme n=1 Tax=Streptomyces sp. NPDC001410 TaxID=3364574 RepID=UPI0036954490